MHSFCFTLYWYFGCTVPHVLLAYALATAVCGVVITAEAQPQPVQSSGLLRVCGNTLMGHRAAWALKSYTFTCRTQCYVLLRSQESPLSEFNQCWKWRHMPINFNTWINISGKHEMLAFSPHFDSWKCMITSDILKKNSQHVWSLWSDNWMFKLLTQQRYYI